MAEADKNRKDDEDIKDDDVEKHEEEQDEIDDQDESEENEQDAKGDDEQDSDDDNDDLKSKVQYPHLVKEGDTLEDYLKRVEGAYGASSKEGKRLSDELERFKGDQLSKIAKGTDLDSDDSDDQGATDKDGMPSFGDNWARSEMRRRNNEAFESFAKEHPELQGETGEPLRDAVKRKFATYASAEYTETGEIPTDIKPLLNAAWAAVAPDSSEIDKRSDLKDHMSSSKTSSAKKRESKSQFSEEQVATAQKLYPNKSRKEIEKLLSEYAS